MERLRFALSRDTIALLVAESGCGKRQGGKKIVDAAAVEQALADLEAA